MLNRRKSPRRQSTDKFRPPNAIATGKNHRLGISSRHDEEPVPEVVCKTQGQVAGVGAWIEFFSENPLRNFVQESLLLFSTEASLPCGPQTLPGSLGPDCSRFELLVGLR